MYWLSQDVQWQPVSQWSISCDRLLTLKEPGFLDPSHSRGGFRPPRISETDWRNIKCVVLVDSYNRPESIGTKKSTNIPCMTPQWRHKWRHVKNTKITKKSPKSWFFAIFSSKSCIFCLMTACVIMFLWQIVNCLHTAQICIDGVKMSNDSLCHNGPFLVTDY